MKYLKLFENYQEKSIEDQIGDIFRNYEIGNYSNGDDMSYTINSDGTIDVNDGIDLEDKKITELPLLNGKKLFRKIYGYFDCDDNELTSIYGSPNHVGAFFSCCNNRITSIIGCPESIGSHFMCIDNKIRTLEGFPHNLVGDFYCLHNPVWVLWILFEDKDKVELFNDFGITDGEVVILERLNDFLEMIGKPIVTDTSDIENEGYKII